MRIGFWWESQKKETIRKTEMWEDNIKMDLREIGWGGMDWIYLAQDRDQWRTLCEYGNELRVP
jgi:hypothetical protein